MENLNKKYLRTYTISADNEKIIEKIYEKIKTDTRLKMPWERFKFQKEINSKVEFINKSISFINRKNIICYIVTCIYRSIF